MTCEEFQDRLNWILDQRLPPLEDVVLREHSMICSACCDQWFAADDLLRAVASSKRSADGEVDLATRVLAEWTAAMCSSVTGDSNALSPAPYENTRRRWYAAWGRWVALVAAASLLVGLSVHFSRPTNPPSAAVTTTASMAQSRTVERELPPSGTALPRPATMAETRVTSNLQLLDPNLELLNRISVQLISVQNEGYSSVEPIVLGLKPVANSLESALRSLRRSLPLLNDGRPTEPQAWSGVLPAVG